MSHQLPIRIKGLTNRHYGTTAEPVCEMARAGRKLTASSQTLLVKGQRALLANAMLLTTREQWPSVVDKGSQLRLYNVR